jgi:two-component SAPR family response regulator
MIFYHGSLDHPDIWKDRIKDKKKFFLTPVHQFTLDFLEEVRSVSDDGEIYLNAYVAKFRVDSSKLLDVDFLARSSFQDNLKREDDSYSGIETRKDIKEVAQVSDCFGCWMKEDRNPTVVVYTDLLPDNAIQYLGFDHYKYNLKKNRLDFFESFSV